RSFALGFLEETNLLKSYEKEDNYEEREGFVKELLSLVKEHFKTNPTHSLLVFFE
ncbi:LOW QUALITY PROTEIN: DNA helicase II/ATP-dependent DNA helicase pcrA, partial [Rhodococcus opacus PD630]